MLRAVCSTGPRMCTRVADGRYTPAMKHRVCVRLLLHLAFNHPALNNMARLRCSTEQRVCVV